MSDETTSPEQRLMSLARWLSVTYGTHTGCIEDDVIALARERDEARRSLGEARAQRDEARAELAALKARRFPVLDAGFSVPWHVVEPHEKQAQANHGGQTLERLADRGGLSACELWHVMHGRKWKLSTPDPECPEGGRALEWARSLVTGAPLNGGKWP